MSDPRYGNALGVLIGVIAAVIGTVIGSVVSYFMSQKQEKTLLRTLEQVFENVTKKLSELNQLADRQKVSLGLLDEKIGFLAEQVPERLRIVVPVDQSGPETGTWGKSIQIGIQSYFRRHGYTITVKGKMYRYFIEPLDDEGERDKAKEIATAIVNDMGFPPIAIVGPISTGCARKSLEIYSTLSNPSLRALHLLPVPTDTALLWANQQESPPALRSPFLFRMPPPNSTQARRLMKPINKNSMSLAQGSCIFVLTCGEQTNEYVFDLKAQLSKEASNIPVSSPALPIYTINGESIKGSHFAPLEAQWPKYVIAIGPWLSVERAPCIRDFIAVWRDYESKNNKQPSCILLSDFPVPDAEAEVERQRNSDLEKNIHFTFQTSPGTLKRARELEPTSGVINLALFAYGYDAAHLIDQAIMTTNSVEPGKLAEFLTKMSPYHGLAQSYKFYPETHENLLAEFHVYHFRYEYKNGQTEMNHSEELCQCRESKYEGGS